MIDTRLFEAFGRGSTAEHTTPTPTPMPMPTSTSMPSPHLRIRVYLRRYLRCHHLRPRTIPDRTTGHRSKSTVFERCRSVELSTKESLNVCRSVKLFTEFLYVCRTRVELFTTSYPSIRSTLHPRINERITIFYGHLKKRRSGIVRSLEALLKALSPFFRLWDPVK